MRLRTIPLCLLTLLLVSCHWNFKFDDESTDITVQRYDRLESRYLTTVDYSALQEMNIDYPTVTRTLVEKVLQLGDVSDPKISDRFLRFYQDSVLQSLITDVETEYADCSDINHQLSESFKRLKKDIPSLPIPQVYTQIGALNQSIIVGEKLIGICLDKYMGQNYPLYQKYYSLQQRTTMTRAYIVPDCITFYLLSLYPLDNYDSREQIEKDLHMGKIMWVANRVTDQHAFDTPYVKAVGKYMRHHSDKTIEQLLTSDDYDLIRKRTLRMKIN